MTLMTGSRLRAVSNIPLARVTPRVPRYGGIRTLSMGRHSAASIPAMPMNMIQVAGLRVQQMCPNGARSMSITSSIVPNAAELPELPDAPRYPCPFLTDEQIATYLVPLYARVWCVRGSNPDLGKPAPELVKNFSFLTPEKLDEFRRDVAEVTQSEDHHAVEIIDLSSTPTMSIRVHTHSGLRPARDANEPRRARVQPGITLRDVRFAYLVEERFSRYLGEESGARRCILNLDLTLHPRTAEAVEERRHVFT
ncbi:hypothetical protein C2E23DRAFT_321367 [Lenzites betulinus]|nr:hypothetical protein C2E23DRAFT_321367 [Lenzites betulinus]